MKGVLFILAFIPLGNIAQMATIHEKAYQVQSGDIPMVDKRSAVPADSIAPDTTGMGALTSVE